MCTWKALLCWPGLLYAQSSDASVLSISELPELQKAFQPSLIWDKAKKRGLIPDQVGQATAR